MSRIGLAVIVIIVSGATVAYTDDSPASVAEFVKRAESRAHAGRSKAALSDYAAAIKLDPEDPAPFVSRAIFLLAKGALDRSLLDIDRGILLAEPAANLLYIRAMVTYELGREHWGASLAALARAIKIDATYRAAYVLRAELWFKRGEFKRAITDLSTAIEQDPQDVDAYEARAGAREQTQEWDLALADYSRAIQLDAKRSRAYEGRARVREHKRDFDGALKDYSQAIEVQPRRAKGRRAARAARRRLLDLHAVRGLFHWRRRAFASAEKDLSHVLLMEPHRDTERWAYVLAVSIRLRDLEMIELRLITERVKVEGSRGPGHAGYTALLEPGSWIHTLGRFLAGDLKAAALHSAAQKVAEPDRPDAICQAHFYVGMLEWIRGNKGRSAEALARCRATKRVALWEYAAAGAVLSWPR